MSAEPSSGQAMFAGLKPYPRMKDSGVEWLGAVPAHWDVVRLKSLMTNVVEQASTARQSRLFIALENVESWTGKLHDQEPGFGASGQNKSFRAGDVLLGKLRPYLAKVTRAKTGGGCVGEFLVLRSRSSEHFGGAYAEQLLRSKPVIDAVNSSTYGARMPRAEWSFIGGMEVVRPPLLEQTAIAHFLELATHRIERYIRAKETLIALLEEERKCATQELLSSSSVTRRRLETVAELIKRPIKRSDLRTYVPIGMYNRGRGIFLKEPRSGTELGDSDFFWVKEGDLVISGQFAWEGAIALASSSESGCVASHRYPIMRGNPDVLESTFLLAFFQSDWGQVLLDHHSRGAAGRNRPLNARTLMKEKISFPSMNLQRQISSMLRREALARLQARMWTKLLREYRTRLMADVVTGKLDVREAASAHP